MIGQIFIHDSSGAYVFIVVVPVEVLDEKDHVLDLYKVAYRIEQPIIIGINSVLSRKAYVVDISDDTAVWVNWQVEWL